MDPVPPELQVEAPEGPSDAEAATSVNLQAIVQQLRAEASQQIEAAVSNVWQKGLRGLQQAQEKRAAEKTALEAELRKFKERQELLAQENRNLRAAVDSLVRCMSGFYPAPSVSGHPAPSVSGHGEVSDFNDLFSPAQSPATLAAAAATLPKELQETLLLGTEPQSQLPVMGDPLKLPVPKRNEDAETSSCQATFVFTLRKADGVPLGLDVSHAKGGRGLRVEKVQAGGAVEAWNRQCPNIGGEAENRVVQPGDMVVAVNNVSGEPSAMLNECRIKQLLRISIVRPTQDKQVGPIPSGSSSLGPDFSGKHTSGGDSAAQKPFQFSKFGG